METIGGFLRMSNEKHSSIECYLEEHRALRAEIISHQETMRNFTILYVTALGSIGGIALSTDHFSRILLMIPLLSVVLGSVVFLHGIRVSQLGLYIRDRLSPSIRNITQDDTVMDWGNYVREKEEERGKIRRWFSVTGIYLIVFFLPSVLALIFSGPEILHSHNNSIISIWGLGAVFTIILPAIFIRERKYWFGVKETDA